MANNNGFLIGSSTITTDNSVVSLHNMQYTGFTFNGNCILDSVAVQNYTKTDVQVLATSVSTLPIWTPDVKFLASFNNTIDGSNVFGMVASPISWSLYRRVLDGDILTLVTTVDTSITSWIDYKCEGNQTYEYLLFANSATQISQPIMADRIETTFYGYFMISSDADSTDPNINSNVTVYKFDINLESDKIMSNNDVTYLKTFSKFDSVVILDRNFRSGSFTSMIIPKNINGVTDYDGMTRWASYLDDLRLFLHDKKYKYLKLRSGDVMKCISEGNGSTSDIKHAKGISIGGKYNKGNQMMDLTIYYTEIGNL